MYLSNIAYMYHYIYMVSFVENLQEKIAKIMIKKKEKKVQDLCDCIPSMGAIPLLHKANA